MTVDREAIADRLAAIEARLTDAELVAAQPLDRYAAEPLQHLAGERLLQLLVEAASDINRLYLGSVGADAGDSASASFRRMAEQRVIPHHLAEQLQDYVKARNVIVHNYLEIDNAEVHEKLRQARTVFRQYMTLVHQALTAEAGDRP